MLETLELDDVRRQFETNVFGLLRMSQLVLPTMRARGDGRIVNNSSMGGKLVFPGSGAYHATKYAVEAFSDAMRFEVGGFGVKIVLIEPGLITTNFEQAALASMLEKALTTRSPRPRYTVTVSEDVDDHPAAHDRSNVGCGHAQPVSPAPRTAGRMRPCAASFPGPAHSRTDAAMRSQFPRPRL